MNSEGVDAWQDVSYKIDDFNYLVFKGTAFFKSFGDIVIGGNTKLGNNIQINIENNEMTLNRRLKKSPRPGALLKPKQVKLSGEELVEQVKQAQVEMKQTLIMMGGIFKGFKNETVFHLPGKLIS